MPAAVTLIVPVPVTVVLDLDSAISLQPDGSRLVPDETRERVRKRFEQLGTERFFAEFAAKDPESAASLRPSDPQRILRAQPASDGSAYDGAFVLHLDGRKVTVLALGARGALGAKHPLRGPSFVWDDSRPEATAQALDQALCAAAKPLGVGFQP